MSEAVTVDALAAEAYRLGLTVAREVPVDKGRFGAVDLVLCEPDGVVVIECKDSILTPRDLRLALGQLAGYRFLLAADNPQFWVVGGRVWPAARIPEWATAFGIEVFDLAEALDELRRRNRDTHRWDDDLPIDLGDDDPVSLDD